MIKNEMQIYLKDKYTDNPIINFLNYWMEPSKPRAINDLDCLYFSGDLSADTIFSVWSPLKMVLDNLNPNEKFYNPNKYGPDPYKYLKKIRDNIDFYLPRNERMVKELYLFANLAETRANYMLWPSQGPNGQRFFYYDQMPLTLYNCFPNGDLSRYFDNKITLSEWLIREKLEMFFSSSTYSKEKIIPLISRMKTNTFEWLKDSGEIIEMLQNMNLILGQRLQSYDN